MSTSPLPAYKQSFLDALLAAQILTFGTYTLKSGRISPYFFNAGKFSTGKLLTSLGSAFAHTIHDPSSSLPAFDVIFGPAYKGIPLATATLAKLCEVDPSRYEGVGYAFDRKEVKDHGEGGRMVGMPVAGKRVLIVDDVITAGTAIRAAVSVIEGAGGSVVGVVVALDRMERVGGEGGGGRSAVMEVAREFGIGVVPILSLNDIIAGVGDEEERRRMIEYREVYGAVDE